MAEEHYRGIVFSSGRKLESMRSAIAIDLDCGVTLHDGTDEPPELEWWDRARLEEHGWNPDHDQDEMPKGPYTAEDMVELADIMIERWKRFRASISAPPSA